MPDQAKLFLFGCGTPDGNGAVPAEVVGSKAANLMRMAESKLPVPPGFVLPTSLCRAFLQEHRLPEDIANLLAQHLEPIEQATGLKFGGARRPLLVSVRSGAAVSMPGMMDTILNVGLSERTLPALIRMTGNPRHAWDSYRRLIEAYGEVVHGLPPESFAQLLTKRLQGEGVPAVSELDVAALRELTQDYLQLFEARAGQAFPADPLTQLAGAVGAVFSSWESPRAAAYRRLHRLDDRGGTAATVQTMVFGNMGSTSGSGVAFSRDPATGEKTLFLDFLWNAQGEDVVAGRCPVQDSSGIQRTRPDLYHDLLRVARQLEELFHDAQDFEFTVQENCLYLLQSRAAKRTPWAALRIACDLVREGMIDRRTALKRLAGYNLGAIEWVRLAPEEGCRPLSRGTPASPGVAVGPIVFTPAAAQALMASGKAPILVRAEIATGDIAGLAAAAGILTARGGRTSHAAVVARQLNKVCIVGCRDLSVQEQQARCRIGDRWLNEGELVSLDGHSGEIFAGEQQTVVDRPDAYLREVEEWRSSLKICR